MPEVKWCCSYCGEDFDCLWRAESHEKRCQYLCLNKRTDELLQDIRGLGVKGSKFLLHPGAFWNRLWMIFQGEQGEVQERALKSLCFIPMPVLRGCASCIKCGDSWRPSECGPVARIECPDYELDYRFAVEDKEAREYGIPPYFPDQSDYIRQ